MTTRTEYVDIVYRERGGPGVVKVIHEMEQGAEKAGDAVGDLERLLAGLASAGTVYYLAGLADQYTQLSNQVKLVTKSEQDRLSTSRELFDLAQETRSEWSATVELYGKLTRSSGDLGMAQQEILTITRAVNQSFKISGAAASEAAGGTRQLAQALASGVLRGDEFNSVMENAPRLAEAIASGMGVARTELRALAQDGKLTAQAVVDALKKEAPKIAEEFEKITPTITESFVVWGNAVLKYVGELDQAKGVSRAVSAEVIALSKDMDLLAGAAASVGVGLVVAFSPKIVAGVWAVAEAVGALAVAMAANPVGVLVSGAAAAGTAVYLLGDRVKVTEDNVVSLRDTAQASLELLQDYFSELAAGPSWSLASGRDYLLGLLDLGKDGAQIILETVSTGYNQILAISITGVRSLGVIWNNFPDLILEVFTSAFDSATAKLEGFLEVSRDSLNSLIDLANKATSKLPGGGPLLGRLDEGAFFLGRLDSGFESWGARTGGVIAEEVSKILEEELNNDFFGDLETVFQKGSDSLEGYLEGIKARVLARAREIADARRVAEGPAAAPTAEAPAPPRTAKQEVAKLSKEEEESLRRRQSLYLSIIGPQRDLQEGQKELNTLLREGRINSQQYGEALLDLQQAAANAGSGFSEGLRAGFLGSLRDAKDLAKDAADLFNSAVGKMEDSLTEFVRSGKLSFKDLANSILEDLTRMFVRYKIVQPLLRSLAPSFGIDVKDIGNFATGGSHIVTGKGGPDSQVLFMRASPGEVITTTRPGDRLPGTVQGTTNVWLNVYGAPEGTRVERQETADGVQLDLFLDQMKDSVVSDVARGGSPLNRALEARYGLNPARGSRF